MHVCQIALGGNLGNVSETFQEALARLDATPGIRVSRMSSLRHTPSVGESAGHDFLNAAAELKTTLEPERVLARLHEVEDLLGRRRTGRWSPRTLDLDLLLFEQRVIDTPTLRVPHPACWYRRFVLDPLSEISPAAVHPERQLTVSQLRERLLARPLLAGLADPLWDRRSELQAAIAAFADEVRFVPWSARETGAAAPSSPVIIFWSADVAPGLSHQAVGAAGHGGARPIPARLPRESELRVPGEGSEVAGFVRDVLQSALGR